MVLVMLIVMLLVIFCCNVGGCGFWVVFDYYYGVLLWYVVEFVKYCCEGDG